MVQEYHIDYADSQVPVSDNWLYAEGHDFSMMDPQYLSQVLANLSL